MICVCELAKCCVIGKSVQFVDEKSEFSCTAKPSAEAGQESTVPLLQTLMFKNGGKYAE